MDMSSFAMLATPYVSENLLTQQDFEVEGQVSHKSSSVLMKLLWVCRLARPDLAYSISTLATQVTRWSRNSDKQLFRLVSYLNSTLDVCMVSQVSDPPAECTLDLFCDADLGGCYFHGEKYKRFIFGCEGAERHLFPPLLEVSPPTACGPQYSRCGVKFPFRRFARGTDPDSPSDD